MEGEMKEPGSCEPNLAGVIVSLGAQTGDKQRLKKYVATYQQRKKAGLAPELQSRYLQALSAFEDPKVVDAVLALSLDGTVPQEQTGRGVGAAFEPPQNPDVHVEIHPKALGANWSPRGCHGHGAPGGVHRRAAAKRA